MTSLFLPHFIFRKYGSSTFKHFRKSNHFSSLPLLPPWSVICLPSYCWSHTGFSVCFPIVCFPNGHIKNGSRIISRLFLKAFRLPISLSQCHYRGCKALFHLLSPHFYFSPLFFFFITLSLAHSALAMWAFLHVRHTSVL